MLNSWMDNSSALKMEVYVPSKRRLTFIGLHAVTFQTTELFIISLVLVLNSHRTWKQSMRKNRTQFKDKFEFSVTRTFVSIIIEEPKIKTWGIQPVRPSKYLEQCIFRFTGIPADAPTVLSHRYHRPSLWSTTGRQKAQMSLAGSESFPDPRRRYISIKNRAVFNSKSQRTTVPLSEVFMSTQNELTVARKLHFVT
jgi:hypothetical protein